MAAVGPSPGVSGDRLDRVERRDCARPNPLNCSWRSQRVNFRENDHDMRRLLRMRQLLCDRTTSVQRHDNDSLVGSAHASEARVEARGRGLGAWVGPVGD